MFNRTGEQALATKAISAANILFNAPILPSCPEFL
jgi:hypothetical protein